MAVAREALGKEQSLTGLYESWNWIGILMMVMSAGCVWKFVTGAMAAVKSAHLFRVPLAGRQEVEFSDSGPVALSMEGKRFTTRFAGVDFKLWGRDGVRIEGRRSLLRFRTTGVNRVRMELLRFDIPCPGRYVLMASGLDDSSPWDKAHFVVFMRPHTRAVVAYILGIVLAAALFVTSLVLLLLRSAGAGLGE